MTGAPPSAGDAVPVILAMGSNVGDRRAHLCRGLSLLRGQLEVQAVSRWVESVPWGPIPQRDFLNLVLRAETRRSPTALLDLLQSIERKAGRTRVIPMGPRTLDIDIVFYGTRRIERPRLKVPHPHWRERPFVAELLSDVAGRMVDPESGRPLADVAPSGPLSTGLRVVRDAEGDRVSPAREVECAPAREAE